MHRMLFGGSFDPPHNGHLAIANNVLSKNIADQLVFIPCANHPFAKQLSPAHHRLAMLNLLPDIRTSFIPPDANESPREETGSMVHTYELERKEQSFSIDTLHFFSKTYPNDTISWLIGSDQLQSFHRWHRYRELLDTFRVYVYPRAGYPCEPLYASMMLLRNMEEVALSSTLVRDAVSRSADISSFVPPQIAEYIRENALYNQTHA